MSLYCRLLASCAALAVFPAMHAVAADYDPPILVEEAPEYVPVEVGSGWYLRGDISYNFNDPVYDFTFLGQDTTNRRIGGSIGAGYHITDNLRTDINLGYIGGDRFEYDDGVDFGEASHTVWTGLVNGYFDLGTVMGFTPYVGAGAGLTYSTHKLDIDSPTLGIDDQFSDRQYSFAYALNAGVSYKVSDNASIDVGYQFLHSPSMQYLDTDTLSVEKGAKYHQIRLGLRYDLW